MLLIFSNIIVNLISEIWTVFPKKPSIWWFHLWLQETAIGIFFPRIHNLKQDLVAAYNWSWVFFFFLFLQKTLRTKLLCTETVCQNTRFSTTHSFPHLWAQQMLAFVIKILFKSCPIKNNQDVLPCLNTKWPKDTFWSLPWGVTVLNQPWPTSITWWLDDCLHWSR